MVRFKLRPLYSQYPLGRSRSWSGRGGEESYPCLESNTDAPSSDCTDFATRLIENIRWFHLL
jgi:hypothetical protein